MKRLSKSATDLSGCKKKTHSSSPDEEEKELHYTTPTNVSDDEAGACQRPLSAASTRSVPDYSLDNVNGIRSSARSTTSEKSAKKKAKKIKKAKQPSEVGIRNVGGQIHSVYKGHQVL